MSDELFNAQVWRQESFPCFEVMTLMCGDADTWCKACTGRGQNVPMVMTEADGKWIYTKEELLSLLIEHNYTLVGSAQVTVGQLNEQFRFIVE